MQGNTKLTLIEAAAIGPSIKELRDFLNGPHQPVLYSLTLFFSKQTGSLEAKYLTPRELKEFWESLSLADRFYYQDLMRNGEI